MPWKPTYPFASNTLVKRGSFGLVLLAFVAIILVFVMDVRSSLERLGTAQSDNIQWGLAQVQVDALQVRTAVLAAEADPEANLREVRRRFDVFYSRVTLFRESKAFAEFNAQPEVQRLEDRIGAYLDRNVPFVDGSDEALIAHLPVLAAETTEVQRIARLLSVEGVQYFSRTGDERRATLYKTLQNLAIFTVALVVLLLLLVGTLNRLVKVADQNARSNRQMRDRVETILSTSLDAVIVTDPDGIIVEYNGAAERVFGYPRETAMGADVADLIVPDHYRTAHHKGMERYNAHGTLKVAGSGIVQLEAKRAGGDVFPVDMSLDLVQTPEGPRFVSFIRDISDRVHGELELLQARDKAIAGEKAKAELLAVMSHEMRTPLNGMLGTLELFDAADLNAEQRRYMRIIRNSGQQLLGHVNDVLDVSRLDAGQMSLNKQVFDLIELLSDTIETLTPKAGEHGNKIRLTPPHPDLHAVWSDPTRLRQILNNLIGNAIKFTRNGTITIEADCDDGLREVEIRVIDDGIGIAEGDIERIFSDFVTIDASYGRTNTGTGLGLGISQRLAHALGGEMGAESEVGEGSVFWMRLPMDIPADQKDTREEDAAPETAPQKLHHGLRGLNVLMVEDNETNRIVAREMLSKLGHKVTEAHDGAEGVKLASEVAFDIILMDISMPGMDGVEATRRIRAGHGPCAQVPIIATTAHALPEELQRFKEAGMSNTLVKPISRKRMDQVITDSMRARHGATDIGGQRGQDAQTADFDLDLLEETRRELGSALFASTFARFCTEVEDFLAGLPEGAVAPDALPAIAEDAHRLIGSTSIFGATGVALTLRKIERHGRDGNAAALPELFDGLRTQWSRSQHDIAPVLADPAA